MPPAIHGADMPLYFPHFQPFTEPFLDFLTSLNISLAPPTNLDLLNDVHMLPHLSSAPLEHE